METDNSNIYYQDIPKPGLQAKNLENWSKLDITLVVIVLLAAIAAGVSTESIVIAIIIILMAIPFFVRTRRSLGRMYYELARGARGAFRQSVLDGIWWQAEETDGRFKAFLRRRLGNPVIPFRLGEVHANVGGNLERVALLHSLDQPYDYLPIIASGGNFANRDVNKMHLNNQELTNLMKVALIQTELKVGISYLRITGPLNDSPFIEYMYNKADPTVTRPEMFAMDDDERARSQWLAENLSQIIPTARKHGAAEPFRIILITIKRTREWRGAVKGTLSDEELYDLPIVELGRSLVELLRESPNLGMSDARCLSLPELAYLVRSSWDVDGILEYHRMRALGEIPSTSEEIDAIRDAYGDEELDRRLQAWPQEIVQTINDKVIKLDGNYIAVLRMTSMPKSLRADEFLALQSMMKVNRWTRQAMVGQSVSGDTETRNLVIGRSALLNFQAATMSNRVVASPKIRRRDRELAQQTEVISADAIAQHFNGLWACVAEDEAKLMKSIREVKGALRGRKFKTEEITGSDFLIDATFSALLGTNRL